MGINLHNIKESSICDDMLHSIQNEVLYIADLERLQNQKEKSKIIIND